MSDKYEKVKEYYSKGIWSIERVKNAVLHNWITAEEYQEITNEEYTQNS